MSKGFAYYTIDTNRYEDRRIKKLKRKYKCVGLCVYDKLLTEIYRVNGYFIEWDDDTLFDLAEYFGESEDLINEIVNYCCEIELFNLVVFLASKCLTSKSIQERFVTMSTKTKRKSISVREDLKLIESSESKTPEFSQETPEKEPKATEENNVLYSSVEYSIVEKEKKEKSLSLSEREQNEQRERFLINVDFLHKKNFIDPATETARFYDHYSARGWKPNGVAEPVTDRRALAASWEEKPANRDKQHYHQSQFVDKWQVFYKQILEERKEDARVLVEGYHGVKILPDRVVVIGSQKLVEVLAKYQAITDAFQSQHFRGRDLKTIVWLKRQSPWMPPLLSPPTNLKSVHCDRDKMADPLPLAVQP